MSVRILIGDVRDRLKELPDECVHCVVTSPPYWGLRDYGVDGQIGLEGSLGDHLDAMVEVFREVRRVLRRDGTLWLNYGDAYACAPNGRSAADTKAAGNDDRTLRDKPISTVGPVRRSFRRDREAVMPANRAPTPELKPKDRMLLPARVAIALQEDGWWVRDEIIWHKPNPMPSSVRDRTTPAHEMIYMLSRSARYFWDKEAVKEKASENTHARKKLKVPGGWDLGDGSHGTINRSGRTTATYVDRQQQIADNSNSNTKRTMGGFNERWNEKERKIAEAGSGIANNKSFQAAVEDIVPFRNPRSVWTIAPKPFKEAHFATFPPDLIRPCILAGCPPGGTVLDPFGGAGTTALVAQEHGRNAILIDLNPEYVAIADRRLKRDLGMLSDVTIVPMRTPKTEAVA
jgi:DNA modification methylase